MTKTPKHVVSIKKLASISMTKLRS